MSGLGRPLQWLMNYFTGTSEYGETPVNLYSSLGYPPVKFAHDKICGDIGRIPIDCKKRQGRGSVNDLRHDGYRLLREEPNKIMSPSVFKEMVMSHALMFGNGRVAIIRDGMGGISELIPMMPDRTKTVIHHGEKYHITYPDKTAEDNLFSEHASMNEYIVFHDDDVLHISGFSFNGVEGLGLLQLAKMAFRIGIDSQKHVANQMQGGFKNKVILEAPIGALREHDKAKEFIDAFNAMEGGAKNAGKAALLREGVKASVIGQSNNDAQLIELQKFSRQDVGLLFGIGAMPGDGESTSYNSLEQENLAYLVALDRWAVKWEEECDRKLRTAVQKIRNSHYFKFNFATLLRTDLSSTMSALSVAITARIMNPNEARAKLDMNPYEGGDEFLNPAIEPTQDDENNAGDDTVTEDDSEDMNKKKTSDTTNMLAVEETLRTMLAREASDVTNGTRKGNFLNWLDRYYDRWENKLADKLEAIGLDRDRARLHCLTSKESLLDIAGRSTTDTLTENVVASVKNWKYRATQLIKDDDDDQDE